MTEKVILEDLREAMYQLARHSYNAYYSTDKREADIQAFKYKCGVLLSLCDKLNIDYSKEVQEYCGYGIEAKDLNSFEEQTRYF